MAVGQERNPTLSSWPNPTATLPLPTLVFNRVPTNMDYGIPGQQWLSTATIPSVMYFMSNVVGGLYNWIILEASGGMGTFGALTVTPGPISLAGTTTINTTGAAATTIGTGGTGAVNIGNVTGNTAVTGSLTVSTNITASTGNITSSAGNVIAGALSEGLSLAATGDIGAGITGDTIFTNGTAGAVGSGALTIVSASGSTNETNAGFIKIYVGATVAYIPYFTTII